MSLADEHILHLIMVDVKDRVSLTECMIHLLVILIQLLKYRYCYFIEKLEQMIFLFTICITI